uniref:Uncharacterized protein n=1 Tax=Lactuca sativa TaxID=4236 RepID=A0A9R1UKN9_LACSA|nr:hypothetical protein LSAT_V11C900471890 [Lactuca sativa]
MAKQIEGITLKNEEDELYTSKSQRNFKPPAKVGYKNAEKRKSQQGTSQPWISQRLTIRVLGGGGSKETATIMESWATCLRIAHQIKVHHVRGAYEKVEIWASIRLTIMFSRLREENEMRIIGRAQLRMEMITRGTGSGSGSGSGSGTDPMDERLHDLITAEVTHCILDANLVIFGTVKEGIIEIMDERIRSFQAEIAAGQIGARAPSFRFDHEFEPSVEVQRLMREFQDLQQTFETMVEINAKFWERALLVPLYAANEEMRYHSMKRDDIREFVSFSGCKTVIEMVEKAHEQEIELELRKKRKPEQVQAVVGQAKKPNTSDRPSRTVAVVPSAVSRTVEPAEQWAQYVMRVASRVT